MQEKTRNITIDMLRIMAMFMIIVFHCFNNTNILERGIMSDTNGIIAMFLRVITNVANGIFFIISGYYLIHKKFKLKHILNLWGKTILFSTLAAIIAYFLHLPIKWEQVIFPILTGEYWFITAYIFLYLMYPFYNLLLNQLTKKQMQYLLGILFIVVSIFNIVFQYNAFFGSLPVALLYYTIGAYVKQYYKPKEKSYHIGKCIIIWIIATIIYFFVFALRVQNLENNFVKIFVNHLYGDFFNFKNPFSVLMAFYIFIAFYQKTIKSAKVQKCITWITPSILSVYLIHENTNLNIYWLYMGINDLATSPWCIPYILLVSLGVFIICIIIDGIRRMAYRLLKKIPIVKKKVTELNDIIERYNQKIENLLYTQKIKGESYEEVN